MRIKIRVDDINGTVIKFLLSAILLYKVLIQNYYEISGMFLLLGLLLLFVIFLDCGRKLDRFLTCHAGSLKIMILYCFLSVLLGGFNAPSIAEHLEMSITVVEFLLIGMCISYYGRTRHSLDFLIMDYLIIYGSMLLCFLARPVVVNSSQGIRYSISPSMNQNALALYISLFIWSVLYLISKKRLGVIIGFGLVGIALYGIFLTGSRKGAISAAIILVAWIFFVYLQKGHRMIRLLVIIAGVGIAAYILIPYLLGSSLWVRLQSFQDQGTKNRVNMYIVGLEYLKMSPITGLGFNGFRHFYGYYSHSSFVEVFVSSGIPLGIMYFYAFFVLVRDMLKIKRTLKENGMLSDSLKIDFKMKSILLVANILIPFAYIIHLYDLTTYYSLGLVLMWVYTPECHTDRNVHKNEIDGYHS